MSERKPSITQHKRAKPRLVVELTDKQHESLKKHLGYGMQRRVFSIIIEDVVDMLNKYGNQFLAAIVLRRPPYDTYMQDLLKQVDGDGHNSGHTHPEHSGNVNH
jgi:hypothetical protein